MPLPLSNGSWITFYNAFFCEDLLGRCGDQVGHVNKVMDRIGKHYLKNKMKKCFLAQTKVQLLGHIINKEDVRKNQEKIKAIEKIPVLKYIREIRSIIVMACYYRSFIFGFAGISPPLHTANSKKRTFECYEEKNESFESFNKVFTTPQLIALPDFESPFVL